MTIQNPPCGPHCGIMAAREGHCDCGLCHNGTAPVVITRSDLLTVAARKPMCAAWYERPGDYRPWDLPSPHVPAVPLVNREDIRVPENLTREVPGQSPEEAAGIINATGA
jgi:hypothetical protein